MWPWETRKTGKKETTWATKKFNEEIMVTHTKYLSASKSYFTGVTNNLELTRASSSRKNNYIPAIKKNTLAFQKYPFLLNFGKLKILFLFSPLFQL